MQYLLHCCLPHSMGPGEGEEADGEGGEEEVMTDLEFDESFLGKKLSDLSEEEAAEEVRWVFMQQAGRVVVAGT